MVDFNKYAYQYRAPGPESYSLGPALRALRDQNMQQERQDNQASQYKTTRADANSQFAATFAQNRSKAEHDAAMAKYQQQLTFADAGRKASFANQENIARGFGAALKAVGGTFAESMGSNGRPAFDFKASAEPQEKAPDFQGTRDDIFGAQGPKMGQPHQIASPAGPGGNMLTEQSPFGPRENPQDRLPGISAAAAGLSQPDAGPPPGPAIDGPPPEGPSGDAATSGGTADDVEWLDPQAKAEFATRGLDAEPGARPMPSTPQNPLNPPAFSPYRVDLGAASARNQADSQSMLQGFNQSIPAGPWRSRMESLTAGIGNSGIPMEAQLKQGDSLIKETTSLMRSEDAKNATSASLGLRQQGQDFNQTQRLREKAGARIKALSDQYKLPEVLASRKSIDETLHNIDLAEAGNGDAGTQAIVGTISIKQGNRISDTDVKTMSQGANTVWTKLERGMQESLIADGFDPSHANSLREVVKLYARSQEDTFRRAQDQMLSIVKADRTLSPEERDAYLIAAAQYIPMEYWDPLVKQYMSMQDESGASPAPPPAGDSLGVVPLPGTSPGPRAAVSPSPKVSPSGTVFSPGRIGAKPPRKPPPSKDPAKLTDAQLQELSDDALMEMLRGADSAP